MTTTKHLQTMHKKIPFWKQLMWLLFHKCPECGATVTTSWNSFADYGKHHYRCDNCGTEYKDD